MVLNVPCIQRRATTYKSRTLHRHTKSDTDLWWETGELAGAAGSSLDGCRTNAITIEEPRSIVMTMNVQVMVHEPDGQSIDQLLVESGSRRTKTEWLLCVWLDEEIGVTRQWCCTRYCLSGPGNLGFYLPVPQLGLEILNIVVLSPDLCERVQDDDPVEKERETNRLKTNKTGT